MKIRVLLTVEVDPEKYATEHGHPVNETPDNLANEFLLMTDALTWHVESAEALTTESEGPPDLIQTILSRPTRGPGGLIPIPRGDGAMLSLAGPAGDGPGLLDIRSQGYGDDDLWDGLTPQDVLEDENTAFVWQKWEPLELWHQINYLKAIDEL